MAGNFGIGLGSFLSGVSQGAQAYQGIQNAKSQNKLRDMQVKQAEQDYAEKQRNSDIQAEVERIGQIGINDAQTKYGGDNKKVLDYYYNTTIPKQQQHLISSGKVEAADMLGKFMETKQAKQLTEASAGAIRMASMGDYQNLGPAIEDILNVSNSIVGDGGSYKFKSVTELKDAKGQLTGGAKLDFIDSAGKPQSLTFNNQNELIGFIRNNAMPDKIVEYAYDQQKQAQAIKAQQIKDERDWKQEQTKMAIQQGYGLAKDNNQSANTITQQRSAAVTKSQLDGANGTTGAKGNDKVAQAESAAAYLRKNNYTEEQIRAYVPALLGVQNNSKNMATRIEDTIKTLSEIDMSFGKLSSAEKIKQAKDYIAMVDGASNQNSGEVANPFPNGGQQSKGLTPYMDTKTGTVVYR
jgi:hypothetical protein